MDSIVLWVIELGWFGLAVFFILALCKAASKKMPSETRTQIRKEEQLVVLH